MIIEAIEDHTRGWIGNETSKSGVRVKRGSYAIEHVMPQGWRANWPLDDLTEDEREAFVHTIGNLTLLTTKLNSSVSNKPWTTKTDELKKHDVMLINRQLLEIGQEGWTEGQIENRTISLIQSMSEIWPVPAGHKSVVVMERAEKQLKVEVIDLISAGLVSSGQTLYPRQQSPSGQTAQILDDGRISVGGEVFDSLSMATRRVAKSGQNGWTFWWLDEKTKQTMSDLRKQYREMIGDEDDEDDVDENDD